MADSTLKINVQTTADTSGIDQVKTKIDDLKGSAATAGEGFGALGGIVGASIGTTVVAAFVGAISAMREFNAEEDRVVDKMIEGQEKAHNFALAILEIQDAMREIALIKALPLVDGIREAQQEIIRLKTEQTLLNSAASDFHTEWERINKQLSTAEALYGNLLRAQQRGADLIKATRDQIAINLATGNEELTIQTRVTQAYDQRLKALLDAKVPQAEAQQLATEFAESVRQQAEATRGMGGAQREYNQTLHDSQLLLQSIRQQQTLIQGAPFMGADAKQVALMASYRAEMAAVAAAIAKLQSDIKGGGLDPAVLEQDQQKVQQLAFTYQQLGQRVAAASQPIRAELTSWVNQFGTTAHQLATTIEQTIGVALQGLNQWIVTGKFNLQSMIQQVEMLGLQLIEQLILQRVMAAINQAAAVGQAAATGPLIAAAYAPAATAVTIATEGQAALSAPAEYAAALLAIQALAVAHSGGSINRRMRKFHDGGLAPDEVPIIAQEGEFMVQRSVAQRPGMANFLMGLNEGMFHGGGGIKRMHEGGWEWHTNPWGETVPVYTPATEDIPPLYSPGMLGPDFWGDTNGPQVFVPTDTSGGGGGAGGGGDIDISNVPGMYGLNLPPPSGGGRTPAIRVSAGGVPPPGGFGGVFGPTGRGGTFPWQDYFGRMSTLALMRGGDPSLGFGARSPMAKFAQALHRHRHVAVRPIALPFSRWSGTGFGGPSGGKFGKVNPDFPMRSERHSGGAIGRMHSGGSAGGAFGAPQVHVYAFTDLKALTRHMGSREGQKIIFDTVQGRRIDLGLH